MEWNVYYYDFIINEIKIYNIFNYIDFKNAVEKDLHRFRSRYEFAKSLRSHLITYFCSSDRWEVLIDSPTGDIDKLIVDVYDQVMLNWDVFVDYCWTH